MTEAQTRALELLAVAYDEDVPVNLGTVTGKVNGVYSIGRRVARALLAEGYVRFANGGRRFLLGTEGGLAFGRAGRGAA